MPRPLSPHAQSSNSTESRGKGESGGDTITPFRLESTAEKIIEVGMDGGVVYGKAPSTVAAAAVYIVMQQEDLNLTQKEIADAYGGSAASIRKRVHDLKECID